MHSMLRTPEQLVLFVVGSSTSEATALMAQTRWAQVYPKRSWPVATTTVGLLRQQSVTDPIWRVTGDSEVRHSLLDLPRPDKSALRSIHVASRLLPFFARLHERTARRRRIQAQSALDSVLLWRWGGTIQDESWGAFLCTLDRRDRH